MDSFAPVVSTGYHGTFDWKWSQCQCSKRGSFLIFDHFSPLRILLVIFPLGFRIRLERHRSLILPLVGMLKGHWSWFKIGSIQRSSMMWVLSSCLLYTSFRWVDPLVPKLLYITVWKASYSLGCYSRTWWTVRTDRNSIGSVARQPPIGMMIFSWARMYLQWSNTHQLRSIF